jgi:hypothetical protein
MPWLAACIVSVLLTRGRILRRMKQQDSPILKPWVTIGFSDLGLGHRGLRASYWPRKFLISTHFFTRRKDYQQYEEKPEQLKSSPNLPLQKTNFFITEKTEKTQYKTFYTIPIHNSRLYCTIYL